MEFAPSIFYRLLCEALINIGFSSLRSLENREAFVIAAKECQDLYQIVALIEQLADQPECHVPAQRQTVSELLLRANRTRFLLKVSGRHCSIRVGLHDSAFSMNSAIASATIEFNGQGQPGFGTGTCLTGFAKSALNHGRADDSDRILALMAQFGALPTAGKAQSTELVGATATG